MIDTNLQDTSDVYGWVIHTDYANVSDEVKSIWKRIASHCIFMSELGQGGFDLHKITAIKKLANMYNVEIPIKAHVDALTLYDKLCSNRII